MSTDVKETSANVLELVVADILKKALEAADAAGKFVVEQLPDVAQQYVLYIGIINSIYLAVILGLFVTYYVLSRKLLNHGLKDIATGGATGADVGFVMTLYFTVTGGFIILPLVIWAKYVLNNVVLAFFAPKILLIQWAADLVK